MAFMRLTKFYRNGKKRRSFWNFFGRDCGTASRKPRRLTIDPLEQRQLLTVSPAMLSDHLVNETLGPGQTIPDLSISTSVSQSMAVDHDGDFVVVYTRVDSSEGVSDQNVYARYYTDEVQRITLPSGTDKFSLIYGGTEIQNISITATAPSILQGGPAPVNGFFKLTYYAWDGVSATPYTTETIAYYEDAFNAEDLPPGYKNPAIAIQDALRKLGADNNLSALKDVTVVGINPQNYQVIFGEGSIDPASGRPLSQIALEVAPDPVFSVGNYPGILITKVREPVEFGLDSAGNPNIPVASDPWQTANAIKLAFSQTDDGTGATPVENPLIAPDGRDIINDGVAGRFFRAPVFSVDPSYGHAMDALPPQEMPGGTIPMDLPIAQVEVTPVLRADGTYDPLSFEIRYIDNSGKTDQPEVMFGQIHTQEIILAVLEGDTAGQTVTFTLGAQPASNVTLTLTKQSGDAAITASPVTLTFTANDPNDPNYWAKPHAITFWSDNDADPLDKLNGTATYRLSGPGFADQTITVNQIDKDKSVSSNFVVSSTYVSVSRGESNTMTVRLAAAPTSTKTVIVSKQPNGNPALKLLNPTTGSYVDSISLTFNSTNWNIPQTVTFNASADTYFTNAVANFLVTSGTFTAQTIVVSEQNFNAVAVPPTGQVQTLSEPGHEFRVNPEEPDNPYTVGLDKTTQSNPSVAMDADGNFIIAWESTVPDLLNYGSKTDVYAERFSPMGLFTPQGLMISNSLVSAPETVSTSQYEPFTVRLVNQPLSDVEVNIVKREGSDANLNLYMKVGADFLPVNSITFTPTDWNTPQTIYVLADIDTDSGNGTAWFDFVALGMDTQTVTTKEIDTNSFIVSDTAISVPEGGANTFSFHPATQPAADLTVTITGSGDGDLTAAPTTLTFTVADPNAPDYWNKFQTVTVSAAPDDDASNGTRNFTLTAAGWNPQVVSAIEADDDMQLVIPTATIKVIEGGTNYFTVALAGQPDDVVYVDVYKYDGYLSGPTEDPDLHLPIDPFTGLPYDPYSLVFTPMDWYVPQTVTIIADWDTLDLGDRTMTSDGNARFLVTAPGYPAQMVSVDEIDTPQIVVEDSDGEVVNALTVWEPPPAPGVPPPPPQFPTFADPTFTIVLDTPPPQNVTMTITNLGDTDVELHTGGAGGPVVTSLTFTTANWNQPVTLTATALTDADNVNGIAIFNFYAPGYAPWIVTIQETDSDNWGVIVDTSQDPVWDFAIQTDDLPVAERQINSFSVVPFLDPAADPASTFDADITVTVTKLGGDQDLMLLDPATGTPTNAVTLIFAADPADPNFWMNPHIVTVQAAEDADTADGIAQFRVAADNYSYVDVTATELDDDATSRSGIITHRDALPVFWLFDQDNLFDPLQDDQDIYSNTVTIRALEGDAAGETFQMQVPTGATIPAGGLTVTLTPKPLGDGSISSPTQVAPYLTHTFMAPGETWQFQVIADEDTDSPPTNGLANYLITAPGYRVDGLSVTSIDNDVSPVVMPQLVVSNTSLLVPEGGSNTFSVSLSSWPDPTQMYCYVTITPETAGDAGLTADSTTLTFIIDNWEAPQTVTINAAEDTATTDGLRKFRISSPNLTTKVVQAVKVNNDALTTPDFVISSSEVNVPEGGSGTFTLALAADPGGPLTVTITKLAGSDADLTATPVTLNFTSANYSTPQTVTINAAADTDMLGGTAIFTVTAPGKTTQLVTANEADDDLSNDVLVREGGVVNYPVKLSYQPASDVTVTITTLAGGDADLSVTPTALTFTPSNWNHAQYVTFSAARDTESPLPEFDGTASFVFSASNYPAATDLTLNVAEIEDDVPDLTVSAAALQVLEGGRNTFTVRLPSAPASDVTVLITRLAGSDENLVAGPIQLLFTAGDYYTPDGVNHRWDLPQTVTISAAPDADTSNGSATFVVSDPSNRYHSWKLTATEIDKLLSVRRELVPDEPLLTRATYWDPLTDSIQMDPYAFRVNTLTTNRQWDPSVAMDATGNFVITWCDEGQDWSYFNDIRARRFSSDGVPLVSPGRTDSQEWLVNNIDTNQHITPYVAMSEDGHFLITWCMIPTNTGASLVQAEVYDAAATVIRQQFMINAGTMPTGDWDYKNDYVIAFDVGTDNDVIVQNNPHPGVRAVMYSIDSIIPIRNEFQVNGPKTATSNTSTDGSTTTWSFGQSGNSVGIDADGDLTISYEGAGPDAYEGDPDTTNEYYMSYYHYLGYSDVFMGYLRAQLDTGGNLVRGEANGVMFTQWDTNPEAPGNSMNVLDSDSVANAQRDGINSRYFVAVPSGYTYNPATGNSNLTGLQGKFYLRLTGYGAGVITIEIEPPTLPSGEQHYLDTRDSGQGGMDNTALAIHNALTVATHVGVNWSPEPNPPNSYDGPVYVRRVGDGEELIKMNTQWEYLDPNGNTLFIQEAFDRGLPQDYVIYEIRFQGDVHSSDPGLSQIAVSVEDLLLDEPLDDSDPVPYPQQGLVPYMASNTGEPQGAATIGMQPDGNFTLAWTQTDYYSTLGTDPFLDPAGNSIFFRNFTESTDTAGPNVSGMYYGPDGAAMVSNTQIPVETPAVDQYGNEIGGLRYAVISFDEDMLTVDPLTHEVSADSVTNPENYIFNGTGSIVHIEYGYNKASELVQQNPVEYGKYLSPIPTNKWEAVLTFDSDPNHDGNQGLSAGIYSITALPWIAPTPANPEGTSGLRDRAGNTLQKTGFTPDGGSYTQSFSVIYDDGGTIIDPPVDPGASTGGNGYTQPGAPGAVASDANGDHVVVWTADVYNPSTGQTHQRVFYRLFDADGSAADLPTANGFPSSEVTAGQFLDTDQNNATVACNAVGDFVVTWTQTDASGNADIYARRFSANGTAIDPVTGGASLPFRVNTFTSGNQQWSNVAMDRDGDFAITWSSYGQEKNGQPGLGYGVYAARFNSLGQVEIPEFQVNTEIEGDQFHSSIALTEDRWIVVIFEGPGLVSPNHEIFVRTFDSKGSPAVTDTSVMSTSDADSRYPDIAASPDGDVIVMTWQDLREDGTGWNIRARMASLQRTPPTGLLPASPEILVNTTTDIDQTYPSVAVDYNGNFVVTWSGYGNQPLQSDASGDGVFFQRYDSTGAAVGGETRANISTAGNQHIASVANDAVGNVVIVFTGPSGDPGAPAGSTQVYKTITRFSDPRLDNVGPFVTEVLQSNGTRLYDGGYIAMPPVSSLTFDFSEDMATQVTVPNSINNIITNLSNWILTRNNNLVSNAISSVNFQYNPASRKYQAVVNFTTPLGTGIYQLTLKLNVMDKANSGTGNGNRLNLTAFQPATSTIFSFTIGGTAELGPEFRINDAANVQYGQVIGQTLYGGSTNDLRENTRSVAMDHDGDFVAVWTSYGQDDPSDLQSGGVYLRVYDRNDNPISPNDILVNQTTAGQQRNASVAMDADGDFIVVWESQGQNSLQPDTWDIYMRRFDSMGRPLSNEIRVNTEYTGDQIDPAVAMNDLGQFVVVWATKGQSYSFFNDVHAQIYNMYGQKVGAEFRVNTINIPGTLSIPGGSYEANPSIAMDAQGNFTVVWEQLAAQLDGINIDTYIAARMYDALGNARTNNVNGTNLEFRIDNSGQIPGVPGGGVDFTSDPEHSVGWHQQPVDFIAVWNPDEFRRTSRNPSIVMDQFGNYIVAWESYQDNDVTVGDPNSDYSSRTGPDFPDSYGIYYRRFQTDGTPTTAGDQNANFVNSGAGLGGPFAGDQLNASIAMDVDGDFAIVWNGQGATFDQDASPIRESDDDGIFTRNFYAANNNPNVVSMPVGGEARVNRTSTGTQEYPSVAMMPNGTYLVLWSGVGVGDSQGIFARRYVEANDNAGPELTGVSGPAGTTVDENQQWHVGANGLKYLVVTFDEEMMPGKTGDGVENPENYRLLKNGVEIYGGIENIEYGLCDAAHAALWQTKYGLDGLATNKWTAVMTIDGNGLADGSPALFTGTYAVEGLAPRAPTVAQPEGISGLRDRVGNPLSRNGVDSQNTNDPNYEGSDFLLPSFSVSVAGQSSDQSATSSGTNPHTAPETHHAVALDQDGDYIAVWTATDPATQQDRVYYRLYGFDGTPVTGALKVDASTNAKQAFATVACDADGDFVVTWTQNQVDDPLTSINESLYTDVYARRFNSLGEAVGNNSGAAFRVNTYTVNNQKWSSVAMDADGDFIITWSSYSQEDNNQLGTGYGIYAQRYNSSGQAIGGEMHVNITTAGNQQNSNVDLADNGNFVIVWQSSQNGMEYDIISRAFNPDGTPALSPLNEFGEYIVNSITAGNQCYPDVAIKQAAIEPTELNPAPIEYVVTWQGPDASGWGIFSKLVGSPSETIFSNDEVPDLNIGRGDGIPGSTVVSTIDVDFDLFIRDINITLTIVHPRPHDLTVLLTSPSGTTIQLFNNVPRPWQQGQEDFLGTTLDDEGALSITNTAGGARPPFSNIFRPEQPLSTFDGENANGTWVLTVIDNVDEYSNLGAPLPPDPRQYLDQWSLDIFSDPALAPDRPVNITTTGDQMYAAAAMGRDGSYAIVWSGRGTQPLQEDTNGHGIYYQRYDNRGRAVGGETRVNNTTAGNQWMPSIGSDGAGNIVIAYTGVGATPGTTDVFHFTGVNIAPVVDKDGPLVSDVMLSDRTRILGGSVVGSNVTSLIVAFGEKLSTALDSQGNPTLNSALNPANWKLFRNGNEVPGAVVSVSVPLDSKGNMLVGASRKYEVTLTLNAALANGDYILVASDQIWDATKNRDPSTAQFLGNPLDGDFDGVPGTQPIYVNQPGYQIQFTVSASTNLGAEFLVNQNTAHEQEFSKIYGTGYAREETTRSVAVDHDGDFAVVWTSYGQDGDSGGVYLRLFRQDKTPITGEIPVNTTTKGNQRNASVAMDADGDLVVVWESNGEDANGSWDIYARRFNSAGQPLTNAFRVNTNYNGDQLNPAVAMDPFGNFVIVWATTGQPYSYFNDIKGQIYNYAGQKVGGEFRVNTANLPGTNTSPGSAELNPTVAMDYNGNFVVAWDQVTSQKNGVVTDTSIYARLFDRLGNAQTVAGTAMEFRVNVGSEDFSSDPEHSPHVGASSSSGSDTRRTARNPQIAMPAVNSFIIVWEAYQDNDIDAADGPDSYGIYYRRFGVQTDGSIAPEGNADHQVNLTVTDTGDDANNPQAATLIYSGDQVNPTIAIDVDGDFVVAWEGNGAQPSQLSPSNPTTSSDRDTQGIFVRSFRAHENGVQVGQSEYVSVQSRVNRTAAGDQKFPAIAMTPSGDYVVVWSGNGVGDANGIFARVYDQPDDFAGPLVTQFAGTTATGTFPIGPDSEFSQAITKIVITFDEEMMAGKTGGGVENPANYAILKNNVQVANAIKNITFSKNASTNKWEAVIELNQTITDGLYRVGVLNSIRDKAGNPLASHGMNPNGQVLSDVIQVTAAAGVAVRASDNVTPPGTGPAIAQGDSGHIIAWANAGSGQHGVYAKIYQDTVSTDASGNRQVVSTALGTFLVSPDSFACGNTNYYGVTDVSVARDLDGDFIVVWSAFSDANDYDVLARRFDAIGNPLGATFRVNTFTSGPQRHSAVAMDTDGDVVVTWQSYGQEDQEVLGQTTTMGQGGYGIYAQRYTPAGDRTGGIDEVQVLNFVNGWTGALSLKWNNQNTIPVTHSGNMSATGELLKKELKALGAEVSVTPSGEKILICFTRSSGAMDQDLLQINTAGTVKTSGASSRVEITTSLEGETGEFRVNDTTINNQTDSSIGMDADGNFVISWTSFGQEYDGLIRGNIYAKHYPSNDLYSNNFGVNTSNYSSATYNLLPGFSTENLVSTVDNPNNHLVPVGTGYDGVVQVALDGQGGGSGVLLANSSFVLTAAHVAAGATADQLTVRFDTPTGMVEVPVINVYVHPNYTGDTQQGNDIALLQLGQNSFGLLIAAGLPNGVQGYELYRDRDEVGKVSQLFGYGTFGTGTEGEVNDADDRKRTIKNRIESTGSLFGIAEDILVADFDDGTSQHDAFGVYFGIHDLGLGIEEGGACHGDSGGPTFIDGKIAGVTSFGIFNSTATVDVNPVTNSSYGEFYAVCRISSHLDWIDFITQNASGEFLVNEDTIAIVADPVYGFIDNQSGSQTNSSVAMDADGDFVISWTSYGQDIIGDGYGAGANGLNGIFARRFTNQAKPVIHFDRYALSLYTGMSYAASDVLDPFDSEGNYFLAYPAFRVSTFGENNQQYSKVAMDADGDFVITWESFQDGLATGAAASYGVYAKRYVRTDQVGYQRNPNDPLMPLVLQGTNSLYTPYGNTGTMLFQVGSLDTGQVQGSLTTTYRSNGEMSGEINVANGGGDQRFPDVGMNSTGDFTVVWTQTDQSPQGIYERRYNRPQDNAGAMVADLIAVAPNGKTDGKVYTQVEAGMVLSRIPEKFIVTFNEPPSTTGGATGLHSVTNPSNWQLTCNAQILDNVIAQVDFAWNATTGKYEAILTLDADYGLAGIQSLPPGYYSLTLNDTVWDSFNNKLDGNYDGTPGYGFTRSFGVLTNTNIPGQKTEPSGTIIVSLPGNPEANPNKDPDLQVNTTHTGDQTNAAVASYLGAGNDYSDGRYVVVWTSTDKDVGNIVAQLYDRFGRAISREIPVSSYQIKQDYANLLGTSFVPNGLQNEPAVAMDSYGNFVVVWSGHGLEDDSGVYARVFDRNGIARGDDFLVNQTITDTEGQPSVAMDADGDFVVTWTYFQANADRDGIYARRFDILGNAKGDEFRVNSYLPYRQQNSDVAMDDAGNFVVVWESDQQDGSGWGIYGQQFFANGTPNGAEFRVATSAGTGDQVDPHMAMDKNGNFVVTWTANDSNGLGVYARRFGANPSNEFLVNVTTANWQRQSDVSIDDSGRFVVTWSGYMPTLTTSNDPLFDVYARVFNADGSDYLYNGQALREFRLNKYTPTDQAQPAVTMDRTGNFVVAWLSSNDIDPQTGLSNSGIYQRIVALDVDSYLDPPADEDGGDDPVTPPPVSTEFQGTAGDDVFEFTSGAAPGSWIVKLNGVQKTVPADATGVSFDGLGGNDTFIYRGAATNDTAEIMYESGVIGFGAYAVVFSNVETITVQAGGGADTLTLHASPNDDVLQAGVGFAKLTSTGHLVDATGFETIAASATSGNDTAYLFSTSGDDVFTASLAAGTAQFKGPGLDVSTTGFKFVQAYGSTGGNDSAVFTGSDGNDTFIASPYGAVLQGSGYDYSAWSFRRAQATGGIGYDKAVLYGVAGGGDTFTADANQAIYTGLKYENKAFAFEDVNAYADRGTANTAVLTGTADADHVTVTPLGVVIEKTGFVLAGWNFSSVDIHGGANDQADLYGNAGQADTLMATPAKSTWSGAGYSRQLYNVALVIGHGEAQDVAYLFDSASSAETLTAKPQSVSLAGPGFEYQALKFGNVQAYATQGGSDTAAFEDSAGADIFSASPFGAAMTGAGFDNSGWNFSQISAKSVNGGNDIARLYASVAGPDNLVAKPTEVVFQGPGFKRTAQNFAHVETYATPGNHSTAVFYDSTGDDTYTGTPKGAVLTGPGFDNSAWNFESVVAYSDAGGIDKANLYDSSGNDQIQAGDVSVSLTGSNYAHRLDNFEKTSVRSTAGGVDRATLDNAIIELGKTDHPLVAEGGQYKKALWLYNFEELFSTDLANSVGPQQQAVDEVISAYWDDDVQQLELTTPLSNPIADLVLPGDDGTIPQAQVTKDESTGDTLVAYPQETALKITSLKAKSLSIGSGGVLIVNPKK